MHQTTLASLPAHLPDETLYGLAARIQRLNCLGADNRACEALFGAHMEPRLGDIPADIGYFCAATDGAYGSPQEVLDATASLPYFRHLASWPRVVRPTPRSKLGTTRFRTSVLSLAVLSNGYAQTWRWCASCLADDVADYGSAYWHRSHQLPGVSVCTKHREHLMEANAQFWVRQQHFWLPGDLPQTARTIVPTPQTAPTAQEIALARIAHDILVDATPPATLKILRDTVLDALDERGLITANGNVRTNAFVEEMAYHFRMLVNSPTFRAHLRPESLRAIAKGLLNIDQIQPPTPTLMLIAWLFGEWKLFKQRAMWREALASPHHAFAAVLHTPRSPHSSNTHRDTREQHRATCLAYVHEHPAATRSSFWRAHPAACRWLAHHDAEWLDGILPRAPTDSDVQFKLL